MSYKNIKNELNKDLRQELENNEVYIKLGYFPTWAQEHRTDSERGLKHWSTEYRWQQYQLGEITRDKAIEYAIKRATTQINKKYAGRVAHLDRVATAAPVKYFSVSVEFKRSQTWGYIPHAEVFAGGEVFRGTASGCGYDKESAAVANAFNECDSILKLIYDYKENALARGENDFSETSCTGRTNGNIIGYGAGYGVIPYFEGGVGVGCFWSIFKKCGYEVRCMYGKHENNYMIELSEV